MASCTASILSSPLYRLHVEEGRDNIVSAFFANGAGWKGAQREGALLGDALRVQIERADEPLASKGDDQRLA